MTQKYVRSEIYSFYELSDSQQKEHEGLEDDMFVDDPCDKDASLPLGNFLRTEQGNNFSHGVYGQSYFSAYFITLSRSNDCAVVAYKTF